MSSAGGDGATVSTSLRGILVQIELHGAVTLAASETARFASADARAALHGAGVLAGAPAAATWPCDESRCAREVRANYDGARKPLVAICSQSPSACLPVELGFDEVAHQALRVGPLVVAACGLLGAVVDRAATAKLDDTHAIGEARPPVLVATIATPPRDVFWARAPRGMDLAAFCVRRERVVRRTLVLVPTAERVPHELFARYAPGEQVELCALADVIEVRAGRIVLCGVSEGGEMETRVSASAPASASASATASASVTGSASVTASRAATASVPAGGGIAALLGVTQWEDVRITMVDGHTVRIEASGKALLRTFVELGFVDARKTEVVTPVKAWPPFLVFCKKGEIRPSEYAECGKAFGANKAVEAVGKALRGAFGLKVHPIHAYSRRAGRWVARFRTEGDGKGEKRGGGKKGAERGKGR